MTFRRDMYQFGSGFARGLGGALTVGHRLANSASLNTLSNAEDAVRDVLTKDFKPAYNAFKPLLNPQQSDQLRNGGNSS